MGNQGSGAGTTTETGKENQGNRYGIIRGADAHGGGGNQEREDGQIRVQRRGKTKQGNGGLGLGERGW